ncbi:hypothetical protein [Kitasatospora sp. SUK 42]|uniref:hypothetical protein n=1 Tax=Kitasatospora sp. SUK 42 TaxID=1588882 RepID=UPI0027E30D27|nr:hypothetical protein [Kitasatospora sp. SUK 42]
MFAESPYFEGPGDLAGFLEGYEAFRTMPGFRLVLARSGPALVGFAFGVLLQSDSRWWHGLLEGAGVEHVTLAVRPEARAAMRMYEALGYRELGDKDPAREGAPVYRYMVR